MEGSNMTSGVEYALKAMNTLQELVGFTVEGVIGIRETENGWEYELEVLEMERIPETNDVMATYSVQVNAEGEIVGYRRNRRYTRAQIERS